MRGFRPALLLIICGLVRAQTIITSAGLPYSHRAAIDGKQALSAPLLPVYGILFDKLTGRLLLHDQTLVSRWEPDGSLLALVGLARGNNGSTANGTLASGLSLQALRGIAQDSTGALYLADTAGRVYRVGLDGVATTYAGGGSTQGDGGLATNAGLSSPRGMVFDSQGNLDIAEAYCTCIRRVSPAGIFSTVYTLPQRPGFFQYFEGLAIDAQDNLYATEFRGSQVLKIAKDGTATVIAGTGVAGFSGDGGPAIAAQLNGPSGVTLDSPGNIYITDTLNNRVRKIAPNGTISTIAGTGFGGFSGDGGLAISAQLFNPAEVLLDGAGNIYITDFSNRRVRVISPAGIISTIVGSGVPDISPIVYPQVGDGGPALNAAFATPTSVAFGPSGDLFVADSQNNRIRKIAPDGTITTVAGNGKVPYTADGGLATQSAIVGPITVVVDSTGVIYFETGDSRVFKVTTDGILHLVAGMGTGTGLNRSGGDGGPAVKATLNEPKGLAIDSQGNIFIGDTSNARLRKVDTNGVITTIAGPGIQGTDYWNAVAIDPNGNIYVAITHTSNFYSVIGRVNPDGTLVPVAGNSQFCVNLPTNFTYDGAKATQVPLCVIVGLTIDAQGVMYIPESFYGSVLRVAQDGTITRIVGGNANHEIGDGGPALLANLQGSNYYSPSSVAFDATGDMFLPAANRIREVIPGPVKVHFSLDRVDFQGNTPQFQAVQVATNIAEPLPFGMQLNFPPLTLPTGGHPGGVIAPTWLNVNRVTGLTGDMITLSSNPAGLPPGVYSETVQITVPGGPIGATLPVTLTVK